MSQLCRLPTLDSCFWAFRASREGSYKPAARAAGKASGVDAAELLTPWVIRAMQAVRTVGESGFVTASAKIARWSKGESRSDLFPISRCLWWGWRESIPQRGNSPPCVPQCWDFLGVPVGTWGHCPVSGSGGWGGRESRRRRSDLETPGGWGAEDGDPATPAEPMPGLSCARVLNWWLIVECLKQFICGANCSWMFFPKRFMFCTRAQRQFYPVGALLSICHRE